MKNQNTDEWQQAVQFDQDIRNYSEKMRGTTWLHRSCKPLDQVDFNEDQQDLFEQECMGMCGL